MQGWIISIVAVIVLGVMLEIVLPEGKISKYVKGTFSLVVIFVIIAPLPKLLKSEFKFDFSTAWQNANETFAEETADNYFEEKESELKEYLALYGYDCDVEILRSNGFLEIENVYLTIYGDAENYDEIKSLVKNKLNVENEKIKLIIGKERDAVI